MQETNTFAVRGCRLDDFRLARGPEVLDLVAGTNSELGEAIGVLEEAGADAVPLVHAWAMPSGRVDRATFDLLRDLLIETLERAGTVDALVLALHGSMAVAGCDDADGALLAAARSVVGSHVPISISLDLHANVTPAMVELADSVAAYQTDPHVDMGAAGARATRLALWMADSGARPSIGLAKRPLLVPAETMNTTTGPVADIRRRAMEHAPEGLLELGIFTVQPWLDVADLGFGVVAVVDGPPEMAMEFAELVADETWRRRDSFTIERFLEPIAAIEAARAGSARPFVLAESADAPTAGAAGDSPAMIAALREHGPDLFSYVPVVDAPAVRSCHEAGVGHEIRLRVGATIDQRWWEPVEVRGTVTGIGGGNYRLVGASFTGMEVSMGRFAVVASGSMRLLLSERPAWTSDPATFRKAGLDQARADVIVVRSCSDFRPNYPMAEDEAVTLDVPGAATPRLENLTFAVADRPPYPLSEWPEFD